MLFDWPFRMITNVLKARRIRIVARDLLQVGDILLNVTTRARLLQNFHRQNVQRQFMLSDMHHRTTKNVPKARRI